MMIRGGGHMFGRNSYCVDRNEKVQWKTIKSNKNRSLKNGNCFNAIEQHGCS